MRLAFYASEKDNRPAVRDLPWPLLARLLTSFREGPCELSTCVGKKCPHKFGQAWSPAEYEPGAARANRNVIALTAAVFDLDHVVDELWKARLRASGHAFLIHSTHTSRDEDVSLRLVIPVSRPMLPHEWPAIWRATVERFGLPADSACGDPSRIYFTPSAPADAPRISQVDIGKPLDVDAILAANPAPAPVQAPDPVRSDHDRAPATQAILHAALARVMSLGRAVQGEGGDALTYRAAAIVRNDFHLSETEALDVLEQWDRFNSPPWGRAGLASKLANAERYASGEQGAARVVSETKAMLKGAGEGALGLPPKPAEGSWEAELERAKTDVATLLANEGADGVPRELFESAADIVKRPKQAIRWRVQGLMVKGGTTMLSGGPKTSKTWAEIELFIAMTTGTKAFGEFPVPEACRAALFLAEDDAAGFSTRLAATAVGRGTSIEDATRNLFVQPRGRAIDLLKLEDVALVIASCRRLGGVDIVGLDPLRDIHSGEEDKSDSMSVVMRHVRAIGTLLDADTFLVHHSRKPSENGSRVSGGQQMRGSSSIHGSVDNGLYILGVTSPDKQTLFTNKMESQVKAGRSAGTFDLTLKIFDDQYGNAIRAVWKYEREGPDKSNVKRHLDMEALALEVMKRYPRGASRTALKQNLRGKNDAKVDTINQLLNDGRLFELGGTLFVQPFEEAPIDPNAPATAFLKTDRSE